MILKNQDHEFLRIAIQAIERIREKSLEHGHLMLASLLDMARTEAEDALRTYAKPAQQAPEIESDPMDDELEADLRRTIAEIRRAE